jgi:hypothetical protein
MGAFPGLRPSTIRGSGPLLIFWLAVFYTLAGIPVWLHWNLTRDPWLVNAFFQYPGSFLTLLVCSFQVVWCWEAARQFRRGDALRAGWLWLTAAAATHLIGRTISVPGTDRFFVGPLVNLRDIGVTLAGPVQMVLVLSGLSLFVKRSSDVGLLKKLAKWDYLLLAIVGAFGIRTAYGITTFLDRGRAVTWTQFLQWISDPLLLLLLMVAVLVRISAAAMGTGMVANCWRSFVMAILLTSVASASSWCLDCTVTTLPMSIGWFMWFIADTAFAMAPALQVAAAERLRSRSYLLLQE